MALGLVYERANKESFDILTALQASQPMLTAKDISAVVSNEIFPTIMNKVGDVITRSDKVDRNFSKFKIPSSEFGVYTEFLASKMVRADDPTPTATGTLVNDFVINNPDIIAAYSSRIIHANYPLTVNSERWYDVIGNGDIKSVSRMIAIAMQGLYDGITHDHDAIIPALMSTLLRTHATKVPASIRKIPYYTGTDVEGYAKNVFATINKAIRDMTQWRRTDFNIMGADMSDSKDDLVLVSFDNPLPNTEQNSLDIITSQLQIGAQARATALGLALGVDVYEMPSAGIISDTVKRAYGLQNFPGMQTADINGTKTYPHADLKYALIGKGALNVALKRLEADTARSARGHFDQTWVQPTLELSWGAGQAIFFIDPKPATT